MWNNRVIVDRDEEFGDTYMVAEVYYNDNDEPVGYCDSMANVGDSIEELRESLKMLNEAFNQDVIDVKDLGEM